jgi:hypothetical protein
LDAVFATDTEDRRRADPATAGYGLSASAAAIGLLLVPLRSLNRVESHLWTPFWRVAEECLERRQG